MNAFTKNLDEDFYSDDTTTEELVAEAKLMVRKLNEIDERLANRRIDVEFTTMSYRSSELERLKVSITQTRSL